MTLNDAVGGGSLVAAGKVQDAKSIRVVVADDHPLLLRGITSVLEAEADIALLAQTGNGDEALRLIKDLSPDIAIVNLHMPGRSGLDVVAALREMKSKTRFVLLAAQFAQEEFMQAIKLDVRGMFLKTMPPALLTRCVRMVHAGEEFIEKNMFLRAFGKLLQHSSTQRELSKLLTRRELAVVEQTLKGLTNKHVARELKISEGTVKMHLHRAYEKLSVRGRVGLMQLAHKNGMI